MHLPKSVTKCCKSHSKSKSLAKNSEQSTRGILSTLLETMNSGTVIKLPKLESVKRTLRSYKNIGIESCGKSADTASIIIPSKYTLSLKGKQFLLYDSGFGDDKRMLIYSTPRFMKILSQTNYWHCDGTFKVVPELFFQSYTIHGDLGGLVLPSVYILLLNKDEVTYDIAFGKLLEFEPALNPFSIMTDFEKAAINALENNFISVINGCFFHFISECVSEGSSRGLSKNYQEDPDFALKIKMLPSLAFLPEMEVVDCFNFLMQDFPENAFNPAKYFEDNYIGKKLPNGTRRIPLFPIRLWKLFSQEFKTNNLAQTTAMRDGTMAFKQQYHVPTPQ